MVKDKVFLEDEEIAKLLSNIDLLRANEEGCGEEDDESDEGSCHKGPGRPRLYDEGCKKTNLVLPGDIKAAADNNAVHFGGFNSYIEHLIRKDILCNQKIYDLQSALKNIMGAL